MFNFRAFCEVNEKLTATNIIKQYADRLSFDHWFTKRKAILFSIACAKLSANKKWGWLKNRRRILRVPEYDKLIHDEAIEIGYMKADGFIPGRLQPLSEHYQNRINIIERHTDSLYTGYGFLNLNYERSSLQHRCPGYFYRSLIATSLMQWNNFCCGHMHGDLCVHEREKKLELADDILFGDRCNRKATLIDNRHKTPLVLAVARKIYDDDDFNRLPVLADALLDVGCENTDIISHCHNKTHIRGCWLIDDLLNFQ